DLNRAPIYVLLPRCKRNALIGEGNNANHDEDNGNQFVRVHSSELNLRHPPDHNEMGISPTPNGVLSKVRARSALRYKVHPCRFWLFEFLFSAFRITLAKLKPTLTLKALEPFALFLAICAGLNLPAAETNSVPMAEARGV